jgi:hypothetical protein
MIWVAIGLVAVIILLGAPALVDPVRSQLKRRSEAAVARAGEQSLRKREALAARQRAELVWNDFPDRAGLSEYLRYLAKIKLPLEHRADEALRHYDHQVERERRHLAGYHDGKLPSVPYQLIVLVALVLFPFISGLGVALDYLIFRGLHPTGSFVLPFGLACLAVTGISVGSIIMLGAMRHNLLPHSTMPYFRRVVTLGGAMLAMGIAVYMILIAPNRSYPAGQAKINNAEQVLQADRNAIPPASQQAINADQAAITQAQANLAHAEEVDRASAAALAFIEIPLSEGAVLGGELLLLRLAMIRRERARREHRHAADAVVRADARFMAELTQMLVSRGHDEEAVGKMRSRFARMNVLVGGQYAGSGPASATGQAGPVGGRGGTPGFPPGTPAGSPAGPSAGHPPAGHWPVTVIPPPGSVGGPVPGGGMATVAEMPAEDLDHTG